MSGEKRTEKIKGMPGYFTLRQAKFLKELLTSKTLGEAAVKAGYSTKHNRKAAQQVLKAVRGRVPDMMERLGFSEEKIIDKYLRRHLDKKKTVFVREDEIEEITVGTGKQKRTEEVVRHVVKKYVMDDNQVQIQAMDKAFLLLGSYAPRDPKEAAQFGVKVIINNLGLIRDGSMPVMDIKPGMKVPDWALKKVEPNGSKKNGSK